MARIQILVLIWTTKVSPSELNLDRYCPRAGRHLSSTGVKQYYWLICQLDHNEYASTPARKWCGDLFKLIYFVLQKLIFDLHDCLS